jgi:predicted RNA methylase
MTAESRGNMTEIEKAILLGLDKLRAQGRRTGVSELAEVAAGLRELIPFSLMLRLLAPEVQRGLPIVPESVAQFLASVARRQDARRVVDPWCDTGRIAATVASVTDADVIGVTRFAEMFRLLERTDARVRWRVGDPLHEADLLPSEPDLVVCCPPFSLPFAASADAELTAKDVAGTLLLRSARCLAPAGRVLVVMTQRAWESSFDRLGAQLGAIGVQFDACLSLPPGTFAPLTNIRTVILSAVRRQAECKLFVAEVNDVAGHNSVVLENWWSQKSARDAASGRWVDANTFTSLERLIARERIEHLARRSGEPIRLRDIAAISGSAQSDDELAHTIAVPLNDVSREAVLQADGVPFKGKFLSLRVDPLRASAPFVARYLNSEIGRLTRAAASVGAALPRLDREALLDSLAYLPQVTLQREVAEVSARIRTLTAQLDDLEHRAWSEPRALAEVREQLANVNHSDGLESWLDTLPFPLGAIVWLLCTQEQPKERLETLLHFFEAYAQFWATILLSIYLCDPARPEERRADLRAVLKRNNQRLEMASFGTWVTLIERVAKELRSSSSADIDSRDLFRRQAGASDQRSTNLLLSKEALRILKVTNGLRNTWKGHGGILGEPEARERVRQLEVHLDELRVAVRDAWRGYSLVRPKSMEFRDGTYLVTIELVSGARAPFRTEVVRLAAPVETAKLHMLGDGSREALPLLPFVRLMPSPKTASNACYFYNRRTSEGVRFVSYHYVEDSDVTGPFAEVAAVVQALSGGD